MKSLINLKVIIMIIATGIFFSCKDNHDGYSDEIKTNPNPSDKSTQAVLDSSSAVKVHGANSTGPGENETSTTNTNTQNTGSSTGTGTGPGPSPKDGSAYTNNSQTDSTNTTPEKTKRKPNTKK